MKRGRSQQQAEQEWEEFRSFGDELVSAPSLQDSASTRQTLINKRDASQRQPERSSIGQQHPAIGR